MKSSHCHALAFPFVLLPLVVWLGGESVELDRVQECACCDGTRHLTERYWSVWGLNGHEVLKDEIEPSPVLRDFPVFRCTHRWSHVSSRKFQGWDGPLWKILPPDPREYVDIMDGGMSPPKLYNAEAAFRDLLADTLDDGGATRNQVARWLERGGIEASERAALEDDEAASHEELDAIWKGFIREKLLQNSSFCPSVQEGPAIPLPEMPVLPLPKP